MITLLGKEREGDYLALCGLEPVLGARMISMLRVYGCSAHGVEQWLAVCPDGAATAAMLRTGGQVTLLARKYADLEEIAAFLEALPLSRVEGEGWLCKELAGLLGNCHAGCLPRMHYRGPSPTVAAEVSFAPSLEQVYSLLSREDALFRQSVPFEEWYPHMAHLIRHKQGACCGILEGGALAGAGLVSAVSGTYSLLSAIVTAPGHRGKGIGGKITAALCKASLDLGAVPGLLCATKSLQGYYEGLGFSPVGQWGYLEFFS